MMKLYSMKLTPQPKNHTVRSEWEMDRTWFITKASQLESTIRRLRTQTKYDSIARILCTVPATKLELQRRLYVVKLGHDGKIWEEVTPLGNNIKKRLLGGLSK